MQGNNDDEAVMGNNDDTNPPIVAEGGSPFDSEAVLDISLSEAGARALLRRFPHVQTLYIRCQVDEDDNNNNNNARRGRPTLASVTSEAIVSMFSILGDHKRITHLVVDNLDAMQEEEREFPLQALTAFLQKAQGLKSLQLDLDVAISGTPEDGRAFLLALQQLNTLTQLELSDFGNESSTIQSTAFSPLMVPNKWEDLSIAGGQVTRQQVEIAILQSQALKKLLIDSNGEFHRHLTHVLDALRNHQCSLGELSVLDDLNEETADACASMVRSNNNTLQHLFLSLGIQSRYGALVTEALLHNNHIESLRFVMSAERNRDATALVHNLRNNRTLKRIHIHFQGLFTQDRVDEVFLIPFSEILEDNYVLEEIKLDKCHSVFSLSRQVEFFLDLNRAGRKELLESNNINSRSEAARALWADKIIQHRSNVNVVFYFLLQNPSFLPDTCTCIT